MSARGTILVGGEALYDLWVDDAGQVHGRPGGGPFNTARTIARLGQPATYLGRLSTDRFGRTHRDLLSGDGVDVSAVVATDDPTTLAVADFDVAGGSASYTFYDRGTAAPGLTTQAALAAIPEDVAVLHVGTLGLVLEPMAQALEDVTDALAGQALVVLDPNCRPSVISDPAGYRERLGRMLRRSDVVKVSEEDLAWLHPDRPAEVAARALVDAGPRVVLLTRGADGVTVVRAGGADDVPAPRVDVVDTIGAGDAFSGGWLAWWRARELGRAELGDADLVLEATRFAVLVAGRTCERAGASPPHLEELQGAGLG